MSNKVIQSYVWFGDKCFFVSTINRESSAMLASGHIYAETMVWRYDHATAERGELVGQGEGPKGSIFTHMNICKRLIETGSADEGDSL